MKLRAYSEWSEKWVESICLGRISTWGGSTASWRRLALQNQPMDWNIVWEGVNCHGMPPLLLRHWQCKEGKQRFCFEEWMKLELLLTCIDSFNLGFILLLMLKWPRGLNDLGFVLVNWELIFDTTKFGLARKIRKFPFPRGQVGPIVHLSGKVG